MTSDLCYEAAIRLLSYRFRGTVELRKRLTQRGFESEEIEQTLSRLEREKWLDDARFSSEYARGEMRKGKGKLRIARQLESLGIERELVRDILAAAASEDDDRERLATACRKKMKSIAQRVGIDALSDDQGPVRNKLISYLLQRGYDTAAVIEAVSRELEELRLAQTNNE